MTIGKSPWQRVRCVAESQAIIKEVIAWARRHDVSHAAAEGPGRPCAYARRRGDLVPVWIAAWSRLAQAPGLFGRDPINALDPRVWGRFGGELFSVWMGIATPNSIRWLLLRRVRGLVQRGHYGVRNLDPGRVGVVLVGQQYQAQLLAGDKQGVGTEAAGGAGFVEQAVARLELRWQQARGGLRLQGHGRGVAGLQALPADRVRVTLTAEALGHVADAVIAGVGHGDGALQLNAQACRIQVGLDKTQHVPRVGFYPVGFGVEHPRGDPQRLVVFAVAVGIARHLRCRHLDIAVRHAERGEQLYQGAG